MQMNKTKSFEASNWNALNQLIALLATRPSKLKRSVVKNMQECDTYVDKATDKDTLMLIDMMRTVFSKGNVYV